jgi:hypothetical protein
MGPSKKNATPRWPSGKRFAFTVFDDTDLSTVDNVDRVYAFLEELGFRTTKSAWPLGGTTQGRFAGATCADTRYCRWLLELQSAGFEIGFHNATYHTSTRERTIQALDTFREIFGQDPRCMANHTGCEEAIYWGEHRLTGFRRSLYRLARPHRNGGFRGHIEGDPVFWGDYCNARIKYVRNFVFGDINTLKVCPAMPYHDNERPFVNYWFAGSEGGCVKRFNRCISEAEQDRLEEEGGACVMYTHFATGFQENGGVDSRFNALLRRLAKKNGWFVPVSALLDHLLEQNLEPDISPSGRARLERRWIVQKLLLGGTT